MREKETAPFNLNDHGIVSIVIKNSKFLLIKEAQKNSMEGRWAPPHAVCRKGLTEEETVRARTLAEVNLHIKPLKKLLTLPADTKVKTVSFWLTKLESGDVSVYKSSGTDYGWFTLDECLDLDLYPGTRLFFEALKNGTINLVG